MYAQLGTTTFRGLKGFTEYSDSRAVNLAEHPTIEGKPKLQKIGNKLQQLSLSIYLHASFCNPETEYDTLALASDEARIMPLILGNGAYVGDFVIENIDRKVETWDPVGNVIGQVVYLQLKESYSTNPLRKISIRAKQDAFASSSGGATPLRIVTPPRPSIGQDASLELRQVNLEAFRVAEAVERARSFTEERPSLSSQISKALTTIEATSTRFNEKVLQPVLNPYAGQIPQAVLAVYSSVQNFRAVLPISNINDVRLLNDQLQGSVRFLGQASSGLIGAVATRRF